MAKRIELNKAAQKVWRFIESRRRPPSYDEIRELFGYRSKNAAFWLVTRLCEMGVLEKDSRGKLCLPAGEAAGGVRLLGAVAAGFPSPAEEELVDTLNINDYLIRNPERTYLIRVTGDSMEGAGIREGDLVLVERGREAKN
ncbi:MAG: hypothetical protein HQL11_04145, partial [Candidatus Omnitrophica bacterium]|nr:hypothetical protein [Candidatus Omnitrophota bacterium]